MKNIITSAVLSLSSSKAFRTGVAAGAARHAWTRCLTASFHPWTRRLAASHSWTRCLTASLAVLLAGIADAGLPYGYERVGYVQGDGSTARILTDFTPNPQTDKIVAEVEFPSVDKTCTIWCARGSTTATSTWTLFRLSTGKFRADYYNSTQGNVSSATVAGTRYTVTYDRNAFTWTGGDGYTYTSVSSFTATGGPLMLFATYYNGTGSNLGNYSNHKLYSFRIYRDGVLIHDYVPCRDASGDATLYDEVSTGQSTLTRTGTFTTGASYGLIVTGSPCEAGMPSPDYGCVTTATKGESIEFSCPAAWTNADATIGAIAKGWRLALADGTATTGTDLTKSITYGEDTAGATLTWLWDVSYKVTATAGAGGTVAKAEQWIKAGEPATMTAVPADGMRFVAWTGDVKSKESGFTEENVTRPMTFNASFAPIGSSVTYWVATNGNDSAVGGESTPFATLANALWFAENGDTVKVKAGTYILPAAKSRNNGTYDISYGLPSFWLTNAVKVVGVEGPEKTIFDGEKGGNRNAFCLQNAGAVLSGVTVMRVNTSIRWEVHESPTIELKNGFVTNCIVRDCSLYYVGGINLRQGAVSGCQVLNVSCSDGLSLGAGINLSDATGTPGVTNCIVSGCSGRQSPALYANGKAPKVYGCVFRNCKASNNGRGGLAPVYVSGGSLENCVITNNQVSSGSINCAGLQFSNAIVRNCLIADNRNNDANGSTGGIYMSGSSAVLENCTVVNNYAKSETAHGLYQAGGTVRNSIIGFNGPTAGVFGQTGNHVKSGGTVTYTDTYPAVDGDGNMSEDPVFVDASGDYHLGTASDLFDKGSTQTWMASAKDLDGKARVSGSAVNPGCYEDETPAVRPFTASGVSDILSGGKPLEVCFTAQLKNVPDADDVSYLWTFGDGATSTEAAPTHVYTSCARFTVTLAVTSGGKAAPLYTFPAPIEVGPSVVYVNKTGSGVWPYDTPETGTNDIVEAMASLHAPANGSAKVCCGPGTFDVTSTVIIKTEPVEVIGDGTTFRSSLLTGIFNLNRPDAVLRGLTLTTIGTLSGSSGTKTYGGVLTLTAGTVTNCTFLSTRTTSWCVAAVQQSGGLLTDCVFNGCGTSDGGAGGGGRNCFQLTGGMIANTVFTNCYSEWGSYASGEIAAGVVSNCLFVNCSSYGGNKGGSAVHLGVYGTNPNGTGVLTHSRIIDCKAQDGAVVRYSSGTALRNVLIARCKASGTGTTLAAERGVTENCTIASCTNGNETASGLVASANAKVYNTIVWDCIYTNGVMRNAGGTGTFDHCLTDADPMFSACRAKAYRPRPFSPAVNAGVERDWMTDSATDLDGSPRVKNRAPDIGCYECDQRGLAIVVR